MVEAPEAAGGDPSGWFVPPAWTVPADCCVCTFASHLFCVDKYSSHCAYTDHPSTSAPTRAEKPLCNPRIPSSSLASPIRDTRPYRPPCHAASSHAGAPSNPGVTLRHLILGTHSHNRRSSLDSSSSAIVHAHTTHLTQQESPSTHPPQSCAAPPPVPLPHVLHRSSSLFNTIYVHRAGA
ncbi:hypothetical protein B0H14DRAFT_851102 [Mycena olivaceomarginata]|nr:hypothetical protein B0H14DRAFT_851102 [Mycena olivaceomarginata]